MYCPFSDVFLVLFAILDPGAVIAQYVLLQMVRWVGRLGMRRRERGGWLLTFVIGITHPFIQTPGGFADTRRLSSLGATPLTIAVITVHPVSTFLQQGQFILSLSVPPSPPRLFFLHSLLTLTIVAVVVVAVTVFLLLFMVGFAR